MNIRISRLSYPPFKEGDDELGLVAICVEVNSKQACEILSAYIYMLLSLSMILTIFLFGFAYRANQDLLELTVALKILIKKISHT